jgi:hypothetical protein
VVAYGEEKTCKAHNAWEFLKEQRGGPEGHRSREIDEESQRWHCSPRRGTNGNAVISTGLSGGRSCPGARRRTPAPIWLIGGEVDAMWRLVGVSSHRAAMAEENGPRVA